MAALSRQRMVEVRLRQRREEAALEDVWREEHAERDWQDIARGRDKFIIEGKGRHWQQRWIYFDSKLKADGGTDKQRLSWGYERNRAEAELRAHVRLLGVSSDAALEAKMAELLADARIGLVNEWRWPDRAGVKRRERELVEWKERVVRTMLAEQARWYETHQRQKRLKEQQQNRARTRRQAVAAELRPIDWSQPPQTFEQLLASYVPQHSKRYKLEVWRHQWIVREMAQRRHEAERLPPEVARVKQRSRFWARRRTEAAALVEVHRELAANERVKRRLVRSTVLSYMLPIRAQLNGWHVYQLLRLVVRDSHLAHLSPAVTLTERTSSDIFDAASALSALPPAPLPASIDVTPFSWPYMLSYAAETARAAVPVVRVREEDDGGGVASVVIEVRNARRDVVVWMYEAVREVRLAATAGQADGVSWGEVVRVGREGEAEAEAEGHALEAATGGGGQQASDVGGEHGWCVLDLGDMVVQTHSEDDTSGVTARRWLSEADLRKRLSAIPVTRGNIITAAG